MSITELDEILAEVNTTVVAPTLVAICPTCGASRLGARGAPHGCSTIATMTSKTGRTVYAATTRFCAQCGSKEHPNLSKNERSIICLWQQFTRAEYPGEFETTDRHGAVTTFADINVTKAGAFAVWLATGAAKVKPRKVRVPAPPKPTASRPMGPTPMATAIADDIAIDPPVIHAPPVDSAPKMSRAERRKAKLMQELAEQEAADY